MDREEFQAALGPRLAPSDTVGDGSAALASEPEQLARAIVEQGRSADVLTDLVNILGGLG